jgi:hypothetical protein
MQYGPAHVINAVIGPQVTRMDTTKGVSRGLQWVSSRDVVPEQFLQGFY